MGLGSSVSVGEDEYKEEGGILVQKEKGAWKKKFAKLGKKAKEEYARLKERVPEGKKTIRKAGRRVATTGKNFGRGIVKIAKKSKAAYADFEKKQMEMEKKALKKEKVRYQRENIRHKTAKLREKRKQHGGGMFPDLMGNMGSGLDLGFGGSSKKKKKKKDGFPRLF